jgi:hypothetical protein
MMRLILRMYPILAGAALTSFGQSSDPAELIRQSDKAERTNSQRVLQYAFREHKVTQDFDKNGKQTDRQTQTWDVVGLQGSIYRKLIQRNDLPLSPKEQKREDERLAKETALRRKESPDERRKRLFSFSYSLGSLPPERFIELFDLELEGEEPADGRTAYLIVATPKAAARPENDNEKENLNYRIRIWIDRDDQIASRRELEVITDSSRMQKGSVIELGCARNDAGVCLIHQIHIRYHLRFLKLANIRGDVIQTFSDYRRFQVDSRFIEPQE